MKRENQLKVAFGKLFKNKMATVCFFVIILEFILIIGAPLFTNCDPNATDITIRLTPGFWASNNPNYNPIHWLGTDEIGRDVWARILYGGRISFAVGFTATAVGLSLGTLLGLLAGYYKKLDNPIMRIMDVLFTFPSILLALLIVAMLGVSTMNATLAISIWSVPSVCRMVRGRVLQIKEEEYITAIRSLGAKDSYIILHHILPNVLPTIIVIGTMRIASAILSIATLSYLGVGVPVPQAEWGGMISSAKMQMYNAPYLIIIPGIFIIITVICFNILGDKLRDILDPSLKD